MYAVEYVPVTVVIPCYMAASTIERAVKSVMAQTVLPAEMIMIDDASPDEGLTFKQLEDIRNRYQQKIEIEIIRSSRNGGPSVARNKGWDSAKQPYIAFLDADDAWHPRKIGIQYRWMSSRPNVAMTGHSSIQLNDSCDFPPLPKSLVTRRVSAVSLLFRNQFPTRSVMLRRDLQYRFLPNKRRSEDYLLWLQIVLDGYQAWLLEVPLACAYKPSFGAGGLTKDLWRMEMGELNTYWRLRSERRIGGLTASLLSGYSLMKHCRRYSMLRTRKGES